MFHATSEGYCSWFDLASGFLEKMNVDSNFIPCSTEEFPTPTKRPANSILENAKANELGINVFKDWEKELDGFVANHGAAVLKEIKEL